MATLLLRLTGPIQAWGDESKYDIRGTRDEPTKSGVIGMVAAAMGFQRDSREIQNLAVRLRFGIRVDQPGRVIRDYHTARAPKYGSGGVLRYDDEGSVIMEPSPYVTQRYYLCDACFLAGLECDDKSFLERIADSLQAPVFPVYLGRRSCPPALPLVLDIQDHDLEAALRQAEWVASDWFKEKHSCIRARIIVESRKGQTAWYTQMDQPISFSPIHRKYTLRGVDKEQYVMLGTPEHDPMAALREE